LNQHVTYLWAVAILLATACARGPGPPPDWNDAVVYELSVRSCFDSDRDGSGDLKGVEMKPDYIRDLARYYSGGIGMPRSASDHSATSAAMQWSSVPSTGGSTPGPESRAEAGNNSDQFSAETRFNSPSYLLTLYKNLAAIRKGHPALRNGGYRFYGAAQGVLAFDRVFGDKRILVLMNLTRKAYSPVQAGISQFDPFY
jgi:glycosidase